MRYGFSFSSNAFMKATVEYAFEHQNEIIRTIYRRKKDLNKSAEEVFFDFVEYLAEKEDFNPAYYDESRYDEYTLGNYVRARLDAFVRGEYTKYSNEKKRNTALINSEEYEDGYKGIDLSRYVVSQQDEEEFERVEMSLDAQYLIEDAEKIENMIGVNPIKFLQVATESTNTKYLAAALGLTAKEMKKIKENLRLVSDKQAFMAAGNSELDYTIYKLFKDILYEATRLIKNGIPVYQYV